MFLKIPRVTIFEGPFLLFTAFDSLVSDLPSQGLEAMPNGSLRVI